MHSFGPLDLISSVVSMPRGRSDSNLSSHEVFICGYFTSVPRWKLSTTARLLSLQGVSCAGLLYMERSKKYWQGKNSSVKPAISWSFTSWAAPCKPRNKQCSLCLQEKLTILQTGNRSLLKKRLNWFQNVDIKINWRWTVLNSNTSFIQHWLLVDKMPSARCLISYLGTLFH